MIGEAIAEAVIYLVIVVMFIGIAYTFFYCQAHPEESAPVDVSGYNKIGYIVLAAFAAFVALSVYGTYA